MIGDSAIDQDRNRDDSFSWCGPAMVPSFEMGIAKLFGDSKLGLLYSGNFGRAHSYAEILEYESKLKSMTQGNGTFSMAIDHLEICPPVVQDKVIKDSGYKAEVEED